MESKKSFPYISIVIGGSRKSHGLKIRSCLGFLRRFSQALNFRTRLQILNACIKAYFVTLLAHAFGETA